MGILLLHNPATAQESRTHSLTPTFDLIGASHSEPDFDFAISTNVIITGATRMALSLNLYSDSLVHGQFLGRSLGSKTSPSAVTSATSLGTFGWKGWNTQDLEQLSAGINAQPEYTFSPTEKRSSIRFFTAPAGGGAVTSKMRLSAAGNLRIGDDTIATERLEVAGNVVASGDLTGTYIHGDGSLLTNIPAGTLSDGAVTTSKILAGAVTTPKLAQDAVTSYAILNESVTTSKVMAGAITTAKLAADAVTESSVLTGAITTGKLFAGAVTTSKIARDAVTEEAILSASVSTSKLAQDSVIEAKILAGSVSTSKLLAGAITTSKLAQDSVVELYILSGSVSTSKVLAGAITTSKLARDSVTAISILPASVTTAKLAQDSVIAANILTGSITTSKLASQSVTTIKIAGFNNARKTSCATSTTINTNCTTVVAWPTTFADTNYTANCAISVPTALPRFLHIAVKLTTSISVRHANESAAAASGTLECVGIHD